MLNTIEIISVKIQPPGWLLNGNIFVPDAPGNSERAAILAWIADGNTPEPDVPSQRQLTQTRINELKLLLSSTDFKVLPDYQQRSGKTDEEMTQVFAERKAWYDELKELTK
jgi:hypothetical protein